MCYKKYKVQELLPLFRSYTGQEFIFKDAVPNAKVTNHITHTN